MKKLTTRKFAYMALFIALVFVFSKIFQIPYTTPFGNTRFHLGNVLCILAGLILGPVHGGLSAGLGSALFDMTSPLYISSAPTTFINKFAMAWVAGWYFHKHTKASEKTRIILASVLGQVTYIILYLLKTFISNYYIMGLTKEAVMVEIVQKAGVSSINGIISVIVASILAPILLKNIKFDD